MIGLDIKVKNEYSNYLYRIFNGINLINYVWEIEYEDFLYTENGEVRENFFGSDVINTEEFIEAITRDSYYMIFADIKAYTDGKERTEIKTLQDFIESNCEIVLLCTDSIHIEFYSKSREILDKVYNNCVSSDFEEVELLSVEDVSGRSLIAW